MIKKSGDNSRALRILGTALFTLFYITVLGAFAYGVVLLATMLSGL